MDGRQILEEIERTLSETGHLQDTQEEQEETSSPEEAEAQPSPHEREPYEPPGATIIHVYVVDGPPVPLEEDARTVESTLESAEEEHTFGEGETPQPVTHPLLSQSGQLRVPLLLLAVCLLMSAVVSGIYLIPLITASASVTLIPASTEISSTIALTVVTGTPHPGAQQVPGRLLSTLMLSQEQRISTTGTGHQQARAAHGTITLYNALPAVQAVPAGTLLVGADGVQVVTEEDAVIPAALMPTEGQISVSAHALQAGPAGNIRAYDISGACCRADVFAQNTAAFRGGQNARVFPMVTFQDINGAVATLKALLAESVQAALQTQVLPGEALITPIACPPSVSVDHAAGDEATQVTVRVDETCTGDTYDTRTVHALVLQAVTQEAAKQLGTGYSLTGEVQVTGVTATPSLVKDHAHRAQVLQVTGVGTWAYQFSDAQLHQMAHLIAGKSRPEATTLLLEQPGVSQVATSVSGTDTSTLPADPGKIRLLVLSRPA
jgi:hypothetical protein